MRTKRAVFLLSEAEGTADGLGGVVAGLDLRLDADQAQVGGQGGKRGIGSASVAVPAVAGRTQ
jgi:hypothetical protein